MKVSPQDLDKLQEIINIGVGSGASVLNSLISKHIELSVPSLILMDSEELGDDVNGISANMLSAVNMGFEGAVTGSCKLIFPKKSALNLISIFSSEDNPIESDSVRIGTLKEIGNIVLNSLMGAISNVFASHLDYSIPDYYEGEKDDLFSEENLSPFSKVLFAKTKFTVEELEIEGDFVLILELGSFDKLLIMLDSLYQDPDDN